MLRFILKNTLEWMIELETKTPSISIIVPVYQVEKYVTKCLASLAAQTMQDFEAILIYTPCTDGTLAILQDYCNQYSNFKLVYNYKGRGVSVARNEGLAAAQGEYIAFVDGDDRVEPEYLQRLYDAIREADADIACCNYFISPSKSKPFVHAFPVREGVYNSQTLLKTLIRDDRLQFYLWNKLWKRSLFTEHAVTFTNMCFEDTPVSVQLFYYAKSVTVIRDPLYYYEKRDGSLVSHIGTEKLNDYLRALASIRNFLEQNNAFVPYQTNFLLHCGRIFFSSLPIIYKIHAERNCLDGIMDNVKNMYASIRYYAGEDFEPLDDITDFPPAVQLPKPGKKRRSKLDTKRMDNHG